MQLSRDPILTEQRTLIHVPSAKKSNNETDEASRKDP
jgi:hypothetical protein